MKFFSSIVLSLVLFFSAVQQAEAYSVPQFTSCVNPQGSLKASYDSGIHGIAGQSGNYSGKDSVYTLSGDALTQCFCSNNGSGIQTNWWKVSSLTEPEVNLLKSQGWNYIPNGALWGLEDAPYLALNSDYACKGSQGSCCSPTTDIPGPGGNGGQGGTGSVLGISTGYVLGLASTGNIKFVLSFLSISILAITLGLILKKRARRLSR